MKFQVNRDVFSEAVSFAVKLLPQRTTLPILSGVLIQANDDGLVLSSFDYEVSSQTEIQADVEETGTVLVSGRLLADAIHEEFNASASWADVDIEALLVHEQFAQFAQGSPPCAFVELLGSQILQRCIATSALDRVSLLR